MPERGGTQGTFLSPYTVRMASGQMTMSTQGSGWFGPLAPLPPNVPREVQGRAFDGMVGANLQNRPKVGEGIDFKTLRDVADAYDLMRMVIETRKDQAARMKWSIKPREGKGKPDSRCDAITTFLRKPDGLTPFADWLRSLLEDLLVLDAPTLYRHRDRAGRLLALEQIDGSTVKRIVDDFFRTPVPMVANGVTTYPVAYQQILKGMALDYTAQDLIYRPRNKRIHRIYGFSPVEQVLTTVSIALRRQQTTLEYFSAGSVPDTLLGVPDTWTPAQIMEFQGAWDALFTGDTAAKRRAKFIPGGMKVTMTREPELKGELDEWLARVVCYAFSVSPQAFSRMMNRATAEVSKGSAEEEGLAPLLDWIKGLLDDIIADDFGAADLEFAWQPDSALDEKDQEEIIEGRVSKGLITINEGRHALGLDPNQNPAADKLMVMTATGFMLLEANTIEGKKAMLDAFPAPEPVAPVPGGGDGQQGGQPYDKPVQLPLGGANARQPRSKPVAKAAGGEDDDSEPEPFATGDAENAILDALAAALKAQGDDTASQVEAGLAPVSEHHTTEHVASAVAAVLAALSFGKVQTLTLTLTLSGALTHAARTGVLAATDDLGAATDDPDVLAAVYVAANARAAELLGLRWTGPADKRTVEPDPAAQRNIVDTLRERIATAVGKLEAGDGFTARAADAVRALPIWGKSHAEGIAANETEAAANGGALAAYEAAGPGWGKRWAILAEACKVCRANAAEGVVAMGHVFASGHDAPPAHPRCRCRIVCEAVTP